MADALLTQNLFDDKVGQTWVLDEPNAPPIDFTLTEVASLRNYGSTARQPFSLFFASRGEFVLPQRIYALRHPTLGPVSVFLVPIGREGDTTTYQAVFN
jgi:hypothetical protein